MKKIYLLILLVLPALACFMPTATPAPITPTTAATPAQVAYLPHPTNTPQPACTITAESLNIRTQPEGGANESSVIGWLYSGDVVTILDSSRGAWLEVRAGDVTGWINSTYCKGQ